jgi:hypothetical protein
MGGARCLARSVPSALDLGRPVGSRTGRSRARTMALPAHVCSTLHPDLALSLLLQAVRLAYQPPATSQQYFSLRINQHQPSATSQTNRLLELTESTVVVILSPSKIKKRRASCPNGKSLFCGPLSVFQRLTCELHHPTAEGLIHTDASSEIKLGSGDV